MLLCGEDWHSIDAILITHEHSDHVGGLRVLAKRLKVPAEYITFQRVADIVNAIKNGEVDFTVTNATAARANDAR